MNGDYFKSLEQDTILMQGVPLIIRLDGRAFHTLTKGFKKPFDEEFQDCMWKTMEGLCNELNPVFAYQQSDEISLVFLPQRNINKKSFDCLFNNRKAKLESISASIATYEFNKAIQEYSLKSKDKNRKELFNRKGYFDSRAFVIPKEYLISYLQRRQEDATKNSIAGLAQSLYKGDERKLIHGVNTKNLQNLMLTQKNINRNNLEIRQKRGIAMYKVNKNFTKTISIKGKSEEVSFQRGKYVLDKEISIFSDSFTYFSI